MKILISLLLCLTFLSASFAQQNKAQELRIHGFSWYEPGSVVYQGDSPGTFQVCTLDNKAQIISSTGEKFMISDHSCIFVGGLELLISAHYGGVMAKELY